MSENNVSSENPGQYAREVATINVKAQFIIVGCPLSLKLVPVLINVREFLCDEFIVKNITADEILTSRADQNF